MADSYLSPRIVSFINYFYSFVNHWRYYVEMDVEIRDDGFNIPYKQLRITLRDGRYNVAQIYDIKDIDVNWALDDIEDLAGDLLKKLFNKKEVLNNGKIET